MFGFAIDFAEFKFLMCEPLPRTSTKTVWSRGEFFRANHHGDKLLYIFLFDPGVNYEFAFEGV